MPTQTTKTQQMAAKPEKGTTEDGGRGLKMKSITTIGGKETQNHDPPKRNGGAEEGYPRRTTSFAIYILMKGFGFW